MGKQRLVARIGRWLQRRCKELNSEEFEKPLEDMTTEEKIELAKFETVHGIKNDFYDEFFGGEPDESGDVIDLLTTETKELRDMIAEHGRRLNALEAKFETREEGKEQTKTIRCPNCGAEFPASMLEERDKPVPLGGMQVSGKPTKVCPLCSHGFGSD